MNELRSALEELANKFIAGIFAAMKSGSLAELADGSVAKSRSAANGRRRGTVESKAASPAGVRHPPRSTGSRRKRSSAAEVEQQKTLAFSTASSLKPGFSKGDLMKKSGENVDLGRALVLLVADGKLSKRGDRRSTRYWVK